METMLGFTGVLITTVAALFAALGLQALLLKATLRLMQPATADRRVSRTPVEVGTRLAARFRQTALLRLARSAKSFSGEDRWKHS